MNAVTTLQQQKGRRCIPCVELIMLVRKAVQHKKGKKVTPSKRGQKYVYDRKKLLILEITVYFAAM